MSSNLLEAAKAALDVLMYYEDRNVGTLLPNERAACVDLRAAIAAEEATLRESRTVEGGAHSCGYHCQRPACAIAQRDELRAKLAEANDWSSYFEQARLEAVAERDALRAKLAAMEAASGEPACSVVVDRLGNVQSWATADQLRRLQEVAPDTHIPLYTHPAPLPAYVPMTELEMAEICKEAYHTTGKMNRAIEQAVLARLGVPHD